MRGIMTWTMMSPRSTSTHSASLWPSTPSGITPASLANLMTSSAMDFTWRAEVPDAMKRISAMEVLPRTSISRTSLALRSSRAATTRWRRCSLLTADLGLRDAVELKMRNPHAAECRGWAEYNARDRTARQMPWQVFGPATGTGRYKRWSGRSGAQGPVGRQQRFILETGRGQQEAGFAAGGEGFADRRGRDIQRGDRDIDHQAGRTVRPGCPAFRNEIGQFGRGLMHRPGAGQHADVGKGEQIPPQVP